MIYLGKTKSSGVCAICKKEYPTGTLVFHNTAKRPGVHLAHKNCWEELTSGRPKKWNLKEPVLSASEELDPPY